MSGSGKANSKGGGLKTAVEGFGNVLLKTIIDFNFGV